MDRALEKVFPAAILYISKELFRVPTLESSIYITIY